MFLLSSVLLELVLAAMIQSKPTSNPITESPEISVALANNELSFKVFKMLAKDGNNDVMSPLSINTALSILMNGANNETLQDIRQFLEYQSGENQVLEETINDGFKAIIHKYKNQPSPQAYPPNELAPNANYGDNPAKLHIANRVFRNESTELLPNYVTTVVEHFDADVVSADFKNNAVEETQKVNQWVSDATKNKITKIFDKVGEDTTLVIVNAVHFQGQWFNEFYKVSTSKKDFYNNGVTATKTDTMVSKRHFNYHESEELDAQLLEMNYFGPDGVKSNFTFVVVLPKQRTGLKGLIDKLNAKNMKSALDSMTAQEVDLSLPKFKVEAEYDLVKDIKPKPLFLSDNAQYSRLSSGDNVVAEVKHKVYIDVNEKGTEAAAVTAVRTVTRSGHAFYPPRQPIPFVADHPFLYLIRDRSNGMILFVGQINKF